MSRLVYEGDLNKNFGEYYPTPYIDKIAVQDATSIEGNPGVGLKVSLSLLFTVPEHNPALPNRDLEFVTEILERIKINLMFTKDSSAFEKSNLYPSEHLLGRFQTYYEKTGIKYGELADSPHDELSLLLYNPSILPIFMTDQPAPFPTPRIPGFATGNEEKIRRDIMGIDDFAGGGLDETGKGMTYDLVTVSSAKFLTALEENKYIFMYDRTGRKILKVTADLPTRDIYVAKRVPGFGSGMGGGTQFIQNPTINVLSFTSILNPDEMRESGLRTNAAMKLLVGDIAYEKVLTDGAISNQTEESYFDDLGDVYIETPLMGLNKKYYKADTTTHKDITNKFSELIKQYLSLVPATPEDAVNTDAELMGSIEVVQNILQTNKSSIDLLRQINNSRKLIINRSPGTRSGALYADMSTLLGRVNDIVLRGTPLTKKLTINAKIFDERTKPNTGFALPTPDPIPDEDLFEIVWGRTIVQGDDDSGVNIADYLRNERQNFAGLGAVTLDENNREVGTTGEFYMPGATDSKIVYNANGSITIKYYMSETASWEEITIDDPNYRNLFESEMYGLTEERNISFGYALFDWLGALRKNSTLATLCDVDRYIEFFGLGPIQKYFIPQEFKLIKFKSVSYFDGTDGFEHPPADPMSLPWQSEHLTFTKKLTKWYTDLEPEEYVPSSWNGHVQHHAVGFETTTNNDDRFKLHSGAVLSNYATERNMTLLPSAPELYLGLNHDKFFAVEFQAIDQLATYMDYDHPVTDYYQHEIEVSDYTKNAMTDIIRHYYYLYLTLKSYVEDASLECSYNNVDGVFNDFFAESMVRRDIANPAAAPYIFCVVAYIKHLDFLTGIYNNDETTQLLVARDIIQKISPSTGTLDQLLSFYQNFIDLYETYYSPSSALGRELELLSSLTPGVVDAVDYSAPYRIVRTFNSGLVTNMLFSAQNEAQRDAFLDKVNYERNRLEEASAAYAAEIGNAILINAAALEQHFADRKERMGQKINYEIDQMANHTGGCKYAWWWDGWDTKVNFPEAEPNGQDRYGLSKWRSTKTECSRNWFGVKKCFDTALNAWKKVSPDGVCEAEYGYVWVNKASSTSETSKVVEFYPTDVFGEPTVFANFRKDRTGKKGPDRCRYIKRAYRIRASDFRYDADHETHISYEGVDNPTNKYGGYYGEPAEYGANWYDYNYTKDSDADRETLTEMILAEYQGEGGAMYYEKRLPGFELIRNYDSFQDFMADVEAGIDNLDHTPFNNETYRPGSIPGAATGYGRDLYEGSDWSQLWADAYDPNRQGIDGWEPPEYRDEDASRGGPGEGSGESYEYSEGDYG